MVEYSTCGEVILLGYLRLITMQQEEEFLRAYEELADPLFRHCYFRVYDRERAKELLQETFIKAWKSMCEGAQVNNMRAYLYRIANNLIIDHARKKKEYSLEALAEQGFDPPTHHRGDHSYAFAEEREVLDHVQKLPAAYREVMLMRYIEGYSVSEIAGILGVSPNVISVRIHRGVHALRTQITYGKRIK